MCAQGINWNTTYKLHIGANQDADTTVVGWENDTTLGEKTETIVGVWGVGVVGPKVEAVLVAQIGFVGGIKAEWTEGLKYDRVPFGQVEIVGDHWGGHGSHWTTVGTSFYMNAGTYAQIGSPILILTAEDEISAAIPEVKPFFPMIMLNGQLVPSQVQQPGSPAQAAVTGKSALSLLIEQALLTGGYNSASNLTPASLSLTPVGATLQGITAENLVSILASALLINHATSASLGVASGNSFTANSLGTTINGPTGGVYINGGGAGIQINAEITKIGQPPIPPATYADLLTAATGAANAAKTAAATAAADAATAAALEAGTAAAAATGH